MHKPELAAQPTPQATVCGNGLRTYLRDGKRRKIREIGNTQNKKKKKDLEGLHLEP
jgi:hypothetical protein